METHKVDHRAALLAAQKAKEKIERKANGGA